MTLLKARYGAVEADFQRFYRIDIADLYSGRLRPLRAARLLREIPPGGAIYRGDSLDERVLSDESMFLRLWINANLETNDQIPTIEKQQAQVQRRLRQQQVDEQHARAMMMRRGDG